MICIYVYDVYDVYVYVCIYIYICMYIYIYLHGVHGQVPPSLSPYLCGFRGLYVCMYVYMYYGM